MEELERIKAAVISGDMEQAPVLTEGALSTGIKAAEIMEKALISGMAVVGDLFESKEYFVPEVLVSARSMEASLAILRPLLESGEMESRGQITVGTVKGDLHDIGKNIVAMVLTGAGYEVENLGSNVPPGSFVEAAERGASIIGLSSLLTTTREVMATVMALLEEKGLRDRVKVIVGGAAVTEKFAADIGADRYGSDANDAVRQVKSLLGE